MNDDQYYKELERINNLIEQSEQKISQITTAVASDSWWSTTNAMTISASVLVFGFLISIIAATLLKRGMNSDSVLKILGTILIVISALFLVVAGYSDKQIASIIGLLGTIAGYLLGKNDKEPKE